MKVVFALCLALSSLALAETNEFDAGGGLSSKAERLSGAGSRLTQPLLNLYFGRFSQKHDTAVRYEVDGLLPTQKAFLDGNLAFAALEDPISDAELAARPGKENIVHVPFALNAVMPAYHLPGVGNLNFTPDALEGIYLGKIKVWNHPELQKANPGVALPNLPIRLLERSDPSGTNYILSGYLSKVSTEWKAKVGQSLSPNWPGGIEVRGSEGMLEALKKQPGSLGYLDYGVARSQGIGGEVSFGTVQNRAGRFVMAGTKGMQAAAANVSLAQDTRQNLADAAGPDSYPISGFSYLVVQRSSLAGSNASAVEKLLAWTLEEGQDLNEGVGYGRLPSVTLIQLKKRLGL